MAFSSANFIFSSKSFLFSLSFLDISLFLFSNSFFRLAKSCSFLFFSSKINLSFSSNSFFLSASVFASEEKAKIKGEGLRNFAIGAFVFIGASNILYFMEQLIEQLFTAPTT